jgi:hypothetical protein
MQIVSSFLFSFYKYKKNIDFPIGGGNFVRLMYQTSQSMTTLNFTTFLPESGHGSVDQPDHSGNIGPLTLGWRGTKRNDRSKANENSRN